MFTNALGFEEPGHLIEVKGFPYRLNEGLNMDQIKAEAEKANEDKPESFRCRHGWHDSEVIAVPESLPPVTQNRKLLSYYLYLANCLGKLQRCRRCKTLTITER